MQKLTTEQAAVVTAFTGLLACPMDKFHEYAEKKMGRPIMTHEFADREVMAELKEASRGDFVAMVPQNG